MALPKRLNSSAHPFPCSSGHSTIEQRDLSFGGETWRDDVRGGGTKVGGDMRMEVYVVGSEASYVGTGTRLLRVARCTEGRVRESRELLRAHFEGEELGTGGGGGAATLSTLGALDNDGFKMSSSSLSSNERC